MSEWTARLSIGPGAVYAWLNATALPDYRSLIGLSRAADIHPAWLLGFGDASSFPVNLSERINDRIKMIVDKLGVSLSQAARELGITRAALRTYVDLGKLPKIDKIEAIAKSSDHSISWLLTGLGPMQPFEGLKEVSSVSLGAGAPVPLDDDQENDRCIREVESFRTLLEDAVRRRDQRLLGWLAIEMNVWRKQIEARFPELGRDHSLPGEGEV